MCKPGLFIASKHQLNRTMFQAISCIREITILDEPISDPSGRLSVGSFTAAKIIGTIQMPDDPLPLPGTPSRPSASNEPSIEAAKPYRTPATLGGTVEKAASGKSLIIWGLLLFSVLSTATATFLWLTPSVGSFGESRARPIKDLPRYVEDFGATRMTEDEYNWLNEKQADPDSPDPGRLQSIDSGDHPSETSVP